METLVGLLILVAGIVAIVRFNKASNQVAAALEAKAIVWTAEIKNTAIKDLAEIDVQESTVTQANATLDNLAKLKL